MSAITVIPEISPTGVHRVQLRLSWTTSPIPEQARVWRVGPSGERVAVRQADPITLSTAPGSQLYPGADTFPGATTFPGQQPPTTTVYDYEAPLDVASTWQLTSLDGTVVAATATAVIPSDGLAWLIHPGAPEWSIPVTPLVGSSVILEQWPTWTRAIARGILTSPSRRSPIVSSGIRQAETGELRLLALDVAAADRLERILGDGSALLLLPPASLDATPRWVSIGDVTEEPLDRIGTTRDLTRWTLPLTVVDAPAGQALAARTYGASSAESATYAESLLRWPTYAARSGTGTTPGGSTPPAGADVNGVTLNAPTATVTGSGVSLQAVVQWAAAISFVYLQIAVRPPSGSAGTAFSTGYAPGTTTPGAGAITLVGSGTCDVPGTWTARASYALSAAGPWFDGPAVDFAVTTGAGGGGGGGTTPPTTGTVIGQAAFTGTTGAALPAPWVLGEVTAGATATLDAGEAKLATGTAIDYAGRSTAVWSTAVPGDVEIRAKVRFDSTEAFLGLWIRADTDGQGEAGYTLLVSPVQDSVLLAVSAWSEQFLAADTARPTAGTARWFAVRAQGSQIQAKSWAVGDTEPTAWAMSATDASLSAGTIYLQVKGGLAGGGTVWVDDVTITDLTGVSTGGTGGGGGGTGGTSSGLLLGASGPEAANGTLAAQLASRTVAIGGTWCDTSAAVQLELWSISPGGEWQNWQGALDIAIGAIFKTAGETWAQAAAGAYDGRWTTCLTHMASQWAPRANSLLKVRFGHECNGSFIDDWNVQPSEVSAYRSAFQRFTTLLRQHVPGAWSIWPLNDGSSTGFDFRTAYPGSAYVDAIGIDTYNQWPHVNNLSQWNDKVNAVDGYGCPVGVEAWRLWALAQGKPLCIPEWSNHGDPSNAGGGGESPFYVQQMRSWAETHKGTGPGKVAYMVLFNQWTEYQMWPSTIQPQTWAAYKAVF